MRNQVKWIIIAVLLVGILAGSMFLYNKYSDEYLNQEKEQQTNVTDETTTDEKVTENHINENPAVDFTVTDANGNKVNLSDYKGKPVVLNFF